jgi:hypothetical protein
MYAQLHKLEEGCLEHGSDVKSWLTNQLPFLQQTNKKEFSAILFGKVSIVGCISCKFIDDFFYLYFILQDYILFMHF